MEASAINEPHPDAAPDDADLFFGEEEPAADPDPGTFNPETGKFDEPEAEAAPDPTPAETDGTTGSTTEPEAPAEPALTEEQVAKANAEIEGKKAHEAKLRAQAEVAAASEEDPPPEPEPSEDPPAAAAEEGGKKSGTLEREYIVFQMVPLNERALKHLLQQIEDGKAPEPRVAYFELHRCNARNVNGAIVEAYTKHQKALGEKTDLAAVSARSFQEKHVEPKQVVETNLSIT